MKKKIFSMFIIVCVVAVASGCYGKNVTGSSAKCSGGVSSLVVKNKNKYNYLIFNKNTAIQYIGEIKFETVGAVCAFSYMHYWNNNSRETDRLVLTDIDSKIIGVYTVSVSKYLRIKNNRIYAENDDGEIEFIDFNGKQGLPQSIYFDGDNYPLIIPGKKFNPGQAYRNEINNLKPQ